MLSPRQHKLRVIGLGQSVGTPNGEPLTAAAVVVDNWDELSLVARQLRHHSWTISHMLSARCHPTGAVMYSTLADWMLIGALQHPIHVLRTARARSSS